MSLLCVAFIAFAFWRAVLLLQRWLCDCDCVCLYCTLKLHCYLFIVSFQSWIQNLWQTVYVRYYSHYCPTMHATHYTKYGVWIFMCLRFSFNCFNTHIYCIVYIYNAWCRNSVDWLRKLSYSISHSVSFSLAQN